MIPDQKMSLFAPTGEFLPPDNIKRCDLLTDLELGSLALDDPTGGLKQAVWKCWFADGSLNVQRLATETLPDGDVIQVQTVSGDVTEVSLAFDSSMRVHIAYVEDTNAKLYWYNPVSQLNEIRTFADASASPRLCLDDKRPLESTTRDILFFYLKDGGLYYRQQRDRFEISYYLYPTTAVKLGQVGMAVTNRVQVELIYTDLCGEEGNFLIFTPVENAYKLSLHTSNIVTADICIMPKSVVTIVNGEYRINSGGWTTTPALGNPGDTFQVRRTSSDQYETTVTCTLTVDWYSGIFSITTGPQGPCLATPYVRLAPDAADASWQDAELYTRPEPTAADAQFLPPCE